MTKPHFVRLLIATVLTLTTSSAIAQNKLLPKGDLLLAEKTLSAAEIHPNGNTVSYVVNKELSEGFWVSEVNLVKVASKEQTVIINTDELKRYAAYGSYASNPTWENDSKLRVNISDGDVGFAQTWYDIKDNTVQFGNMEDYDDWEPPTTTIISKKAQLCLPSVPERVLLSGHLEWVEQQKLILYQARHAGYDSGIWLLNVESCDKFSLVNKAYSKSEKFHGWLSKFLFEGDELILFLQRGYQKGDAHLYKFRLSKSGSPTQVYFQSFSGTGSGTLNFLGNRGSSTFFTVGFSRDFCSKRLYQLENETLFELKMHSQNICDASLATNINRLALVTEASNKELRKLIVTDLKK